MLMRALLVIGLLAGPTWAAPDWETLGYEAAHVLSQYVQINTTNPPGNELPAAQFLERVLAKDGITATLYPSGDNRANLVARVPGTAAAQPVLLLHHMDVVPAEPADWSFPPFSGEIRDGYVYGRGTIDDKGHGAVQLVGLLARVREQRACSRDIIFAAVADEEVGGAAGAVFMVTHHPEVVRAEAAWNEGGASVSGVLKERIANSIAVTEKDSLWLTLTASGEGGHGSAPIADGGINILLRALERIADWETPIHLVPSVREMFGRLGGAMFPGGGWLLSHLDAPVIGQIAAGRVTSDRVLNGLVRNTVALTGLRAGVKHNVIPRKAEADLDVRLLPDQDPAAFLDDLRAVIDDSRITVATTHPLPDPDQPSSSPSPFFQALSDVLAERLPDSITVPGLLTGGSDCKTLRAAGIPCYGYQPLIGDSEIMRRIHGLDERIAISDLRFGVQVTYEVLDRLCAAPAAAPQP